MDKTEAFKIVLEELRQCPLLRGKYDAKHGSPEFMNGISTVMEAIAIRVSDEEYEKFNTEFINNILKSEINAGR